MSPEISELLCELGASLAPAQRVAFEAAARAALAAANCSGCGAAYRLLAPLQRGHWDPPADDRQANLGARHHRSSKLANGPPIGAEDPRTGARDRHRFKAV
jgi:hypothetical protein